MDREHMTPGSEHENVFGLGFDEMRRHWLFVVVMGVLLIILGAIAVSLSVFVTLASVLVIGWLLIIGGVAQGIHAFFRRRWGGFFLDLLVGTLYVIVGILMIGNPLAAAEGLTLLLTAFLLVGGVFRIAVAAVVPFDNRWSILASGIIALFLGILLWAGWPETGLWILGFFIGIEMIVNGWSALVLGLAVRHGRSREVEQTG
ncbi:MAG: acid-resistance membrane protein [Syntrophorhabdaceae bacterium PtaU1.Bin034]|nr:MAG: acid-resistance membrane protein [Syntrophorhabdaceae bacterium PtaU1.Bin034]